MPELHRIYDDVGESPSLPPDQERRYLLHGFGRFVERAARRRPLVLCFEDLHWADESSLLLITALVQIAAELPLLLVGTYRPGEVGPGHGLSRTLEDLTRRRLATEIHLSALSQTDVAQLLAGRAGQPPPDALVSLVYDETEGNPFFVEEVFLHFKERGELFDDAGRWRAGLEIADTEVPRTVRLVIERRLERVSGRCAQGADRGRSGGAQRELRVAPGRRRASTRTHCSTRSKKPSTRPWWKGRTAAVRSCSASCTNRSARRCSPICPRSAGSACTSASPTPCRSCSATRPTQRAADIAHHLQLAGTAAPRDRAIHYLEVAARNAIAAVAPEDAVRHIDAALELAGPNDDPQRAELLAVRRAPSVRFLASTMRSQISPPRWSSPRPGSHTTRSSVSAPDSTSTCSTDRPLPGTSTWCSKGCAARGDRAAELDALLALARAHYVRSLDEQEYAPITRATYEETYAFAAAVGDKRAMVEALLPTAWFTDYWADYEPVARANVAEAVRLTDELGDERLSIEAQTAALRFVSGPESTDRAEELRERLEAMHDPVRLKEHYFWLMWHYLGRAQFERCVETCDLGIDLARQLGSAPVQYGSIKTLALIELGRYDLVEAALGEEVTDDAHPFGQANQAYARARTTSPRSKRGSRRPRRCSTPCSGRRSCRGYGCNSIWSVLRSRSGRVPVMSCAGSRRRSKRSPKPPASGRRCSLVRRPTSRAAG